MPAQLIAWIALLCIVAVHMLAGHLRFITYRPRSRWLSAAGGLGAAYVFLHLMPDLQAHHEALRAAQAGAPALWRHAYLIALAGLVTFYALERWAKRTRGKQAASEPEATPPRVFWISIAAFAVYNALLGYLIVHEIAAGSAHPFLFTLAIGVHFAANDHGLYHDHKRLYARYGRKIIAGAAVAGGIAGEFLALAEAATAGVMAFLIGAMIMNILKEELPEVSESRIVPFMLGAFGYGALLLAL